MTAAPKTAAQRRRPRKQRTVVGDIDDLLFRELEAGSFDRLTHDPMEIQAVASARLRIEIRKGGAVMAYLGEIRAEAIRAILGLTTIDPTSVVAIIGFQRSVVAYLNLLDWIDANIPGAADLDEPGDDDAA